MNWLHFCKMFQSDRIRPLQSCLCFWVTSGSKVAKHCLSQLFTGPHLSPWGQNKKTATTACIFLVERRVGHDAADLWAWMERAAQLGDIMHHAINHYTRLMSSNRTHSKAMVLIPVLKQDKQNIYCTHKRRHAKQSNQSTLIEATVNV